VPLRVFEAISELRQALTQELVGFSSAERIRTGFEVAIVGLPNAGKSSLINALAKRDVAIVSSKAGTTRDVIELRYDLRGLAVTFLDTAGMRDTGDDVERIGIDRAISRAKSADLRIHMSQDGVPVSDIYEPDDIIVRSHSDVSRGGGELHLSTVTGEGIDLLLDLLYDQLHSRVAGAGLISHARQVNEVSLALFAIDDIENLPAELIAEALRTAGQALDRLLGRIGAEDYLDLIFSSFCIGK